ncbi:hypothetical protein [Chryseobacterium sp.]|uniref:hypothetical protein n=1 Tax=Chryseobacterium sp. TaxID=1871047 RepID=UPI0024E1A1A1|nr:hypothetical protein [Chryseobacterium sp.]
MLLLSLTSEEMAFLTDISRTTIPLFAAMSGAYLTYRFQKKDKIRDHLFSYKAKAYSNLAQGLSVTQKDIVKLLKDIKYIDNRDDYTKQEYEILQDLQKAYSEYYIFLSGRVLEGIVKLEILIRKAFENNLFGLERKEDEDIDREFKSAFNECSKLITLLQDDLEIYRINNRKRFWQ